MQPRIPLAFFAVKAYCWLMFNLMSTKTPRSFSAKLLSSWVALAHTGACGCSSSGAGLFAFLLNFMRFTPAHFSSLSRTLWVASHPSGISTTRPSFVSSASLLRVHVVPSSKLLMKMFKRFEHTIDPGIHHDISNREIADTDIELANCPNRYKRLLSA
ncbi:hypothetical protein QYF61_008177 [Mycteria americana]|uniref:Uncharacterized protein n=1 Tax=Mycteria americana TaxID=33587 RepID=A0AAN7NQZ5_MYCAM|nr:hypothetical protein QYF61_008177 [Mycteria americana]